MSQKERHQCFPSQGYVEQDKHIIKKNDKTIKWIIESTWIDNGQLYVHKRIKGPSVKFCSTQTGELSEWKIGKIFLSLRSFANIIIEIACSL